MNEKKSTIKDVAALAGVSISVVSYVLNKTPGKTISNETQERVIEAAEALNYTPSRMARGLRSNRSMCIGIVNCLGDTRELFGVLFSGINKAADDYDYRVMTNLWHDTRKFNYLKAYDENIVDGLIFIAPYEDIGVIDEKTHIEALINKKVPFVVINGHTFLEKASYINYNFYESARLATEYLISQGHKEITYVTRNLPHFEIKQRRMGYEEIMKEEGLRPAICFIEDVPAKIKEMKAAVTDKSITAYEVLKEAAKKGIKVPQDLAVIAANNQSFSEYLTPPLSTVKFPVEETGEYAVKVLMELINGGNEEIRFHSECILEIREST